MKPARRFLLRILLALCASLTACAQPGASAYPAGSYALAQPTVTGDANVFTRMNDE